MIVAFIYDTLETTITYLLLIVIVGGFYLVLWGFIRSIILCCLQYKSCNDDSNNKSGTKNGIFYTSYSVTKRYLRIWSYAMFSCTIIIAVYYMLAVILFIFMLASFNDFQAAHNLVIAPALVVLVSIFVTKPFYTLVKERFHTKYDAGKENKTPKIMYI